MLTAGLSFPLYDFAAGANIGGPLGIAWELRSDSHLSALERIHTVRLEHGTLGEGAAWHRVTSTSRGEYARFGAAPHVQVLSHDTSEVEKVRASLAEALVFTGLAQQGPSLVENSVLAEFDELAASTAVLPVTVVLDDLSTEFHGASTGGVYAAAANLEAGTVSVCGVGQLDGIRLERVRDIASLDLASLVARAS